MITAERWYDGNPDLTNFNQGDVIKDIPYAFWPQIKTASGASVWGILRPLEQMGRSLREVLSSLPNQLVGRAEKDVPDAWKEPDGEYVISGCKKMNVMIVSRSCAVDNPKRKHFLIAPVVAVGSLPEAQRGAGKLEELRKNGIPHYFYLPPQTGLAESYADLLRLEPIHRSFFEIQDMQVQLVARLSSTASDTLQMALSQHFGTQFGFDCNDTCPQTGEYSCSNCFHEGLKVEKITFYAQKSFGPCKLCNEAAAWVKMPIR